MTDDGNIADQDVLSWSPLYQAEMRAKAEHEVERLRAEVDRLRKIEVAVKAFYDAATKVRYVLGDGYLWCDESQNAAEVLLDIFDEDNK